VFANGPHLAAFPTLRLKPLVTPPVHNLIFLNVFLLDYAKKA